MSPLTETTVLFTNYLSVVDLLNMKNIIKHRPEEVSKNEVQALTKICHELSDLLTNIQNSFHSGTLVLPENELNELVLTTVEFAEDIINEIGIWDCLEKYNIQFFGPPFRLSCQPGRKCRKNF